MGAIVAPARAESHHHGRPEWPRLGWPGGPPEPLERAHGYRSGAGTRPRPGAAADPGSLSG